MVSISERNDDVVTLVGHALMGAARPFASVDYGKSPARTLGQPLAGSSFGSTNGYFTRHDNGISPPESMDICAMRFLTSVVACANSRVVSLSGRGRPRPVVYLLSSAELLQDFAELLV